MILMMKALKKRSMCNTVHKAAIAGRRRRVRERFERTILELGMNVKGGECGVAEWGVE